MRSARRAGLSVALYFSMLLLGSAVCAAGFRRHLMVWKIYRNTYVWVNIIVVLIHEYRLDKVPPLRCSTSDDLQVNI